MKCHGFSLLKNEFTVYIPTGFFVCFCLLVAVSPAKLHLKMAGINITIVTRSRNSILTRSRNTIMVRSSTIVVRSSTTIVMRSIISIQ